MQKAPHCLNMHGTQKVVTGIPPWWNGEGYAIVRGMEGRCCVFMKNDIRWKAPLMEIYFN